MLNLTPKTFMVPAAAMLFACASVQAQQAPPPASNSSTSSASATQSVADAARQAKAQKGDTAPAKPRVFDNDNIPTTGGISTVGEPSSSGSSSSGSATSGDDSTKHEEKKEGATKALDSKDEKGWRALFQDLRHKLEQDQQDLDISQRELGKDDVQFYSDPVKGMQQGLSRSDINDKTAKIDSLKQKIQADNDAISNAEDQLRAAGGDPGWAR